MSRLVTIGLVLLTIALGLLGCGGGSNQRIKATWIPIQVEGDSVAISVSEVSSKLITHFLLGQGKSGDIAFMAYQLNDKVYVRSNVCPPCRSVGFSLQGDTLVCDTCQTTFKAKTGDGIKGACVAYPKASIPYELKDNAVVMKRSELVAAYQNTLNPGWP